MNITKNFLPLDQYNSIRQYLHSYEFPWYFNEYSVTPETQFQFVHYFYNKNKESNLFALIEPILNVLNPKILLRAKVNLNTQTTSIIETGMHKDYDDPRFMSSVLFFNTCDGYLKSINNEIIYSEDNKIVKFNSNLEHTGSTTTNEKRRIVLTLIYLP